MSGNDVRVFFCFAETFSWSDGMTVLLLDCTAV